MNTRGLELTSEYTNKNITMNAAAKPGEIEDAEDKFRTEIPGRKFSWGEYHGEIRATDSFVGDGEETEFELTYTPVEIDEVTINDVATEDYTRSGKVITFTTAPDDEAAIKVIYVTEV